MLESPRPTKECCLLPSLFLVVHVAFNLQAKEAEEEAHTQSTSTAQQPGDQQPVEAAMSNSADRTAPGDAQSAPAAESQGMASDTLQASPHTARAPGPYHASGGVTVSQSATMLVPTQATRGAVAEPNLAAAETLSPESAVASPARLQSPDQALPGLSAFQMRLHSMLPQLPTMEKLAHLSQEVSIHSALWYSCILALTNFAWCLGLSLAELTAKSRGFEAVPVARTACSVHESIPCAVSVYQNTGKYEGTL